MVVLDPLLDRERAGADRFPGKLSQPHLLDRGRGNNAQVAVEPTQERTKGSTQHQLDSVIVDDLGMIVGVDLVVTLPRNDDRFRVDLLARLAQLASLDHSIEGELDSLRIE